MLMLTCNAESDDQKEYTDYLKLAYDIGHIRTTTLSIIAA